jgi:2'-5' RNA ligase
VDEAVAQVGMPPRVIGVAIAIPEPYGSQLQSWRERLGDPLALSIPTHVTLLGPTEVTDGELPKIDDHLSAIAREERSFGMHLRGSGSFRPVSPVVFVQLSRGISDCERLERAVRSGPLDRPLRFNYHPHVTVAHDVPDEVLDRAYDELSDYDARFAVLGFGLYEHGADGVWRQRQHYPFTT